jgi:hypothetical protein
MSTVDNLNIGSYLGIPIVLENGQKFGALCVVDEGISKFNNLIKKSPSSIGSAMN